MAAPGSPVPEIKFGLKDSTLGAAGGIESVTGSTAGAADSLPAASIWLIEISWPSGNGVVGVKLKFPSSSTTTDASGVPSLFKSSWTVAPGSPVPANIVCDTVSKTGASGTVASITTSTESD